MRKCGRCGEQRSLDYFNYSRAKGKYHHACKPCVKEINRAYYLSNKDRIKKQAMVWRANNMERYRDTSRARYQDIKREFTRRCFDYYGWECSCCGESEKMFLTIDHVENNGKQHREEIGGKMGPLFYKWLVENSFPSGFQVLCFNCNCGKHRNKGICPHKSSGGSETIREEYDLSRSEAQG